MKKLSRAEMKKVSGGLDYFPGPDNGGGFGQIDCACFPNGQVPVSSCLVNPEEHISCPSGFTGVCTC